MGATVQNRVAFEIGGFVLELAAGSNRGRIDREAGIIYGVKLVGVQSRNTGRTLGLDYREFGDAINQPYSYDPAGLKAAIPLYEGATVYLNHQPWAMEGNGRRVMQQGERPTEQVFGWPRNVRLIETGNPEVDGLYGDIHYIKSHRLSEMVLEIAERNPMKLAISHEAIFDAPKLKNGKIVLSGIAAVEALAMVNQQPGTTRGLFESLAAWNQPMPKRTVRQVIEAMAAAGKPNPVLEMMGEPGYAEVSAAPVEAPEGDMEAAMKAAFRAMIVAAFDDPKLDTKATKEKIGKILAAFDKLANPDTGNGGNPMAADKGDKGGEVAEGKGKDKAAETTAAAAAATAGAVAETNAAAIQAQVAAAAAAAAVPDKAAILLESADLLAAASLPASGVVLEAMAGLPSKEKRTAYVQELAAQRQGAGAVPAPRSAPAPKPAAAATEPPAADKFKEPGAFATACRR